MSVPQFKRAAFFFRQSASLLDSARRYQLFQPRGIRAAVFGRVTASFQHERAAAQASCFSSRAPVCSFQLGGFRSLSPWVSGNLFSAYLPHRFSTSVPQPKRAAFPAEDRLVRFSSKVFAVSAQRYPGTCFRQNHRIVSVRAFRSPSSLLFQKRTI